MREKNNRAKVCGTCRFTKHDTEDFYCSNKESDLFTCYVRYGDSCELHEEKIEGKFASQRRES